MSVLTRAIRRNIPEDAVLLNILLVQGVQPWRKPVDSISTPLTMNIKSTYCSDRLRPPTDTRLSAFGQLQQQSVRSTVSALRRCHVSSITERKYIRMLRSEFL
jgi:hypothetical protein